LTGISKIGWAFSIVAVMLNAAALLQFMDQISLADNIIPAVLVFDMIALPVVAWGAYRLGEMAEVEHVREHMQREAGQPPTHHEGTDDTTDREKLD
jgi:hypothetical protein